MKRAAIFILVAPMLVLALPIFAFSFAVLTLIGAIALGAAWAYALDDKILNLFPDRTE